MTEACRLCRWTETYLDGELSAEHTVDYEAHLSECCNCQNQLKFEQALRFSMRRTVRIESSPSDGFEAKLRALMVAEREQNDQSQRTAAASDPGFTPIPLQSYPRPLTWRTIAPLSVAAAAALVFAALRNEPTVPVSGESLHASTAGSPVAARDTMQTVRDFLDQLAADTAEHSEQSTELVEESDTAFLTPRPPAMINVANGRHWPRPQIERLGGIWEGLHYRNLARAGRVPSLHYRIGGHRVLLWAYNSERVPLRVLLEPHIARNQPVFVGTHNGLAVAAVERGGHGVVATTDLSPSEAAELVVTAAAH